MTKDEFRRLGAQVYGVGWQSKMARDLDYNPSTVRRWASGAYPVPTVVAKLLLCRCPAPPSPVIRKPRPLI